MNKKELLDNLRDLDEELFFTCGQKRRFKVVIAGGSALMLQDLTPRPTTNDIDVFESTEEVRSIMSRYGFNARVSGLPQFVPYNFEDRLIPVTKIKGKCIDFWVLSPEDLVVMKLYRWSESDITDITNNAILEKLDWDLLEHLVYGRDEARLSIIAETSISYQEMIYRFEEYKSTFKEKQ